MGHSESDISHRQVVEKLLSESDIICLQETCLSKQDLGSLNSINKSFHEIGESTTDKNDKIIHGHITGGGGCSIMEC